MPPVEDLLALLRVSHGPYQVWSRLQLNGVSVVLTVRLPMGNWLFAGIERRCQIQYLLKIPDQASVEWLGLGLNQPDSDESWR